jgi:hypothetical protein
VNAINGFKNLLLAEDEVRIEQVNEVLEVSTNLRFSAEPGTSLVQKALS